MIWAVLFLGITNAVTVAGWAWSATLDYRERRILLSTALAANGQQAAANRALVKTPQEERQHAEAEVRLSRQIREAAAPYSATNPFGR